MMLTYNETEFTGRPRSIKEAGSRQSYFEKQDILCLGSVCQALKALVQEKNIKILPP